MSKIVKNYLYNMSYQILVMILPIITTPYISRVLKPEGIGRYNYAYSIASLAVVLIQLGTNLYGQREIAFVQNDSQKRSNIFFEILCIRIISTIIAIPGYIYIIQISKDYSAILYFMLIYLIANVFDISWLYQGMEEFKRTAIRNIGVKLIGVLLIFAFVHQESDLLLYTVILAMAQLIGNITLWIGLNKIVHFVPISSLNIKKHVKPVFELFLPTAAMYVYVYVDKIILGVLADDVQVGYYSQAEKIVKLLLTVITSLGAVLLPHISYSINNNQMDDVQENVKKAISYVFYIGMPMVFGAIIISNRFIPLFLGTDYYECISLFSLLSVLIVIIGLASVVGQAVLIPMKKQFIYSVSIISGASINFILDLVLIPNLKSIGASIGTVAAELTVTIIQLIFVSRFLQINLIDICMKMWKCIASVAIMFVFGIFLDERFGSDILCLFAIVFSCSTVYLISLIILKDSNTIDFIKKVKRSFR